MMVLIAGPTLVIYIVILGLAGANLHARSKKEAEAAVARLAASYSARFDGYLREAARVAQTTAQFMAHSDRLSDEEVYRQLESDVRQMPLIYGACAAFEPGTRRPAPELFGPYVCRVPGGDSVRRVNIDRSVYDWYSDPRYTWYSRPKALGKGVWSPPYFDEGAGNILMSTFSAPYSIVAGRAGADGTPQVAFGGICTVDIDLPNLRRTVGTEINENLDFVILAPDGRYVYHPDATRIMARPFLEYTRQDGARPGLAALAPRILAGASGAEWIDGWDSDEALGIFYSPIPSTGWVFVARVPREAVLSDARQRTVVGSAALLLALLLIAGCIYFVAGRVAAPIAALEKKVLEVSAGNLDAHIEETAAATEIVTLAKSFNAMTADLRANVERLAVEKAARQRIERDLDIAHEIQQGLLPTTRPDIPGYEIAGFSRPADQTGGDYYDWQLLPDGRLLISLADVAGHGVGPALVTAVCRAYARASTMVGMELGGLLDRLNDLLIADIPEGRFVTFAAALLDPKRDTVQMISAGHGPNFRCIAARRELIESGASDVPLGLVPDVHYGTPDEFQLQPGDYVILLTDGLFEALNPQGEKLGLRRLRNAILGLSSAGPAEMIQGLTRLASSFAGTAQQEDDITIVALRRAAPVGAGAAAGTVTLATAGGSPSLAGAPDASPR